MEDIIKKVLNLYHKNKLIFFLIKIITGISKKTQLVKDEEGKISEFRYVMD